MNIPIPTNGFFLSLSLLVRSLLRKITTECKQQQICYQTRYLSPDKGLNGAEKIKIVHKVAQKQIKNPANSPLEFFAVARNFHETVLLYRRASLSQNVLG